MDWDDSFDDWHDEGYSGLNGSNPGTDGSIPEEPFDPTDISNPVSAYLFLSDDAQDEITGKQKKKMKCQSCGHRFAGEDYDDCSECGSVLTEEILSFEKDEEMSESTNMKCLDCGHLFEGESYDSCPECFSGITEEIKKEDDGDSW